MIASRFKFNQVKALFIISLFIMMLLKAMISEGQAREKTYKGLEASFGVRSHQVDSNIDDIMGTNLEQAGGRIGVAYGNDIFRSKMAVGYYSSTGNVAGTIDLYQANASLNFYPLSLLFNESPRLQPYITGGVTFDNFKFYGYYLNGDAGMINYSVADAPYLGSTRQVNASIGFGLEFKILDQHDFVHVFSEVTYGHNMTAKSTNSAFDKTSINNQIQANIGISFGMHRY